MPDDDTTLTDEPGADEVVEDEQLPAPDDEGAEEFEPEPEAEPEPGEPDEVKEEFLRHMPELESAYDGLTHRQRQSILMKRLEVLKDSKARADDAPAPVSLTDEIAFQPDVSDADEQAWTKAFEEGDAATVRALDRKRQKARDDAFQAAMTKMVTVLEDRFTAPDRLRQAIAGVPGATEADLPAAKKLLASRAVTTAELAVELAVARRGRASGSDTERRGAATGSRSKRKVQAMAADAHGRGAPAKGVTMGRPANDMDDIEALMEAEARAAKQ